MITDGLSYPVSGDDSLRRFLIGSLLGFGSVLVVPAFLQAGYLLRVLESGVREEVASPAFDDWGEMFVTGMKATAVTLVYGLVPLGLFVGSVATILGGAAAGVEPGVLLTGVDLLGTLPTVGASVAVSYLLPAALTNVAVDGRVRAGFDAGRLKDVAFDGDYLLAWLVSAALAVVSFVVTVVLTLTVVGALLVPFVQFYVQMAVFYTFGRAYDGVTGAADDRGAVGEPSV